MAYFEPEFVEEVKSRADIVSVIQDYIPLKKKGQTYMTTCPFHQEKTPSFGVNKRKQFYNCFSCKEAGNVFKFVMRYRGLSFPQAVEEVAARYNIPIPEQKDLTEEVRQRRENKRKIAEHITALNKQAVSVWQENLSNVENAQQYLIRRGLSVETIENFQIGYANDDWKQLVNKFSGPDLVVAGLATVSGKNGEFYDRFHERIMFPVMDDRGNPVAFGGRVLGKDEPKYLNSPETPLYVKGEHLYGLWQNAAEIKSKGFVIITEGYLDLISLYEAGIKNVVASLGTAFTEKQAKLLARHTKKVLINFDGDSAGIAAARRAVEPLLAEGFDVKVVILPGGQDPDDFVRKQGTVAYHRYRAINSKSFLDFFLENSAYENKSERMDEVLELITNVESPIERRDLFDKIMSAFNVQDAELKKTLWNIVKMNSYNPQEVKERIEIANAPKLLVAEKALLELLVTDKEVRDFIVPVMEETDYNFLVTAPIFSKLQGWDGQNYDKLCDNLPLSPLYRELVASFKPLREQDEDAEPFQSAAEKYLVTLRMMSVDNRIQELSKEMTEAENQKDLDLMREISKQQIELIKLKRELRNAVQR